MGLNTYPSNPFPPSTDRMDADVLEAEVNKLGSDVDQLKSGLTNVDVALSVPQYAGRNLLPMTLDGIKAINTDGTWDGNAYTVNGVTYTVNTDSAGYITDIVSNGDASENALLILANSVQLTEGDIINGSIGGSTSSGGYGIGLSGFGIVAPNGDKEITATYAASSRNVYIRVSEGGTVSNVVFQPMIRPAKVSDTTYCPYIPSVESRIEAVESYTAVNTIYKPEQRAWSGNSLVYNIPLNSSNMIHFIACQTNVRDTFVEAYFVLREQTQAIIVQKSSEGLTLTYDSTTKKTTVTLPETGYWIERMEMCARSVS